MKRSHKSISTINNDWKILSQEIDTNGMADDEQEFKYYVPTEETYSYRIAGELKSFTLGSISPIPNNAPNILKR